MQTRKRPLTEVEKTQLALTKAFHQKRLKSAFRWKHLIVAVILEIIFEVYDREELSLMFGDRLRVTGEKFQPVKIRSELKWDIIEALPLHREIIASNVESFLRKIKEKAQAADDIVS